MVLGLCSTNQTELYEAAELNVRPLLKLRRHAEDAYSTQVRDDWGDNKRHGRRKPKRAKRSRGPLAIPPTSQGCRPARRFRWLRHRLLPPMLPRRRRIQPPGLHKAISLLPLLHRLPLLPQLTFRRPHVRHWPARVRIGGHRCKTFPQRNLSTRQPCAPRTKVEATPKHVHSRIPLTNEGVIRRTKSGIDKTCTCKLDARCQSQCGNEPEPNCSDSNILRLPARGDDG